MILLALAALAAMEASVIAPAQPPSAQAAAAPLPLSPAQAAAIARCSAGQKSACGPALTEAGRAFVLQAGALRPEELEAARKACGLGVPVGCALFGTLRFREGRTPAARATGRQLIARSCAAKDEIGCTLEATILLGGSADGSAASRRSAKPRGLDATAQARGLGLLDKTCEASKRLSCVVFAGMLASGELAAIQRDQARAFRLDARACEAGEVAGCRSAGYALHEGVGTARDLERAAAFYGKSCDGGDGYGCSDLGLMALAGEGVPKAPLRAEALFRRGCGLGQPEACRNLSAAAHQGGLGPADPARLLEIDALACDGGAAAPCLYLFQRYAHGDGVPQDDDRAVSLVALACQRGEQAACDLGTRMNSDAQSKCAAGTPASCYLLALTKLHGVGTAVDRGAARTLLKALCAKGAKPACDRLSAIGQ